MHPTLIEIGPFALHSYGFMLALSFFFGILLAARRAPARGVTSDQVFDTSLVIVFASVIGARLMYVLFHRAEVHSFIDVIAVWRGGLTMYGGVLAAMAAAWFYLRRRDIPFLRMADIVAPSLGLGLMLTRVGCFLNGCCYGKPTESALGVRFPESTFGGQLFAGEALHPTQLYSSAVGLVVVLTLLAIDRRRMAEGRLFAFYLILAGLGRFALDFFRFYEANVYVLVSLTVNQMISLGGVLVGVLLFVSRRHASPAPASVVSDSGAAGAPARARVG